MKFIASFLLIFLSACAQYSESQLYDSARQSAARVLTEDGNPSGSGFLVDTKLNGKVVITNKHVCRGKQVATIELPGLNNLRVKTNELISSDLYDLCLIKLPSMILRDLNTLPLANNVKLWTRVYALGYPLMHGLTISKGYTLGYEHVKILAIDEKEGLKVFDMFLVETSTPIYPGNSGSPALNADGEIIGVFNSGDTEAHFGNFVPLDELKDFLVDK